MPRGRAAKFEVQRETILQGAAEAFALHGYASTTMSELARELGMSKALLYHYYADKYQLLRAIAEGHIDRLTAVVRPASPHDTEAELPRLIACIMQEYAQARFHHQVLVQDIKYLSTTDQRRIRRKEKRVVDAFAHAIAAAHPALATQQLEKPLTMLLFGMINWLFTWFRAEGRLSYTEMASLVTQFVAGGLRATARGSAVVARATKQFSPR